MKHQRKVTPLILGTCLLAAVSCGSDDDSSSSVRIPQEEEQTDQGTFKANLTTLNSGVGGNAATGTADITIVDDEVSITVNVNGAPARITHVQHIHSLNSCPTMGSDVNGDGFLDVIEGVPSYGPILVPLDGDLSSQSAGGNIFPSADGSGAYNYNRATSLATMLEDLRMEDTDPTDAVTKLGADEDLNLAGRHIVIHGVPESVELPDTVQTIGDIPREATLPIACGTIERVPAEEETGTTTGDTGGGDDTGSTTGDAGGGDDTGSTTGDAGGSDDSETTTGDTGI